MSDLAVVQIKQLLTLRGPDRPRTGNELSELDILSNAGMLIRDGHVVFIGTSDEVHLMAGELPVLDAGHRLITPGFVDSHTHLVFAASRANEFELRSRGATYQDIAAAGGGILSSVDALRKTSEDELLELTQKRAQRLLSQGTTTAEVKSGYGLSLGDELKMLRVIRRIGAQGRLRTIGTFLGAHSFPPEFRENRAAYVDLLIKEWLPIVAKEGLAEYCDVFCEENYFDREMTRRICEAAKALGLRIRLHVDQLTRSGGAQLAAEVGATSADHLEQTDEAGIDALRSAGVFPILLPASVQMLGLNKYPLARQMIERGLPVVVATDFNPGSSPVSSMCYVHTLCCTQMRMSPAECMSASTINAAYSLGLGDLVGSLQPGKRADFVLWDTTDYRELAYYAGSNLALQTYASGRRVH